MRNASLTKTLLCGVMATTFFLINCQKAPNRGVKAQGGNGSITTPDGKTVTEEVFVECSPAFVTAYTEADKLVKEFATKAAALKSDSLNSEKDEVIAQEKVVRSKVNDAVAEITKIKADATACKLKDPKTQKESIYTIANIKGSLDKVNLDLAKKEVKTEGLSEAEDRKAAANEKRKQDLVKKSLEGLSQNMEFNISEKLAEVMKKSNVGGVVYFKAGNIIERPSTETLEKDRKDTSLTICEIGEGSGDVEKADKAKVTSIDMETAKDTKTNRYKLSVVLDVKSVLVNLDCLVSNSDAEKKLSGKAFRNVFGKNLLTDANIEAEKKKADAKKVTLDQAKTEVTKRDESVSAQEKAIVNKTTALTEKEAQLAEANAAATKDEAKIKSLTEEVAQLKSSIEDLKKDLENLKKLATQAKEALAKAEKETPA